MDALEAINNWGHLCKNNCTCDVNLIFLYLHSLPKFIKWKEHLRMYRDHSFGEVFISVKINALVTSIWSFSICILYQIYQFVKGTLTNVSWSFIYLQESIEALSVKITALVTSLQEDFKKITGNEVNSNIWHQMWKFVCNYTFEWGLTFTVFKRNGKWLNYKVYVLNVADSQNDFILQLFFSYVISLPLFPRQAKKKSWGQEVSRRNQTESKPATKRWQI